jgi:hypothetical integral membrane protein (TIGR02206 family)
MPEPNPFDPGSMMDFFDPTAHSDAYIAFGSWGHLGLLGLLFGLLALMIVFRKRARSLADNRPFMATTAAFVLLSETSTYILKFIYGYEPFYERFPLHLCGSLKIALTILILLERYDLAKYISIWCIGAGFISFANLNLDGVGPGTFMFWHYLWGHFYLFLAPILIFLAGKFRYDLRFLLRSLLGLFVWSFAIFLVNWAFDTNYMYSGPHNTTEVPFIPARFMVWPLNYLSYVLVALILLSGVYLLLRAGQRGLDKDGKAA